MQRASFLASLRLWRPARTVLLTWLLTLTGCDVGRSDTEGWRFADLPEPRAEDGWRLDSLQFSQPRRYGVSDGLGALGRIVAVAADDSLLAVADAHTCDVVLFSRVDQRALRRFGRCGDGPGEFRGIRMIQMAPDGIWIADQEGRRLRHFTRAGDEQRALYLDTLRVVGATGARYARLIGDSLLVVTTYSSGIPDGDTDPVSAQQSTTGLAHVVRLNRTAARFSLLEDGPEVGRRSAERGTIAGCVVLGAGGEHATLVAMNRWVPQVVALTLHPDTLPWLNALYPDIPQRPIAPRREPDRRVTWRGFTEAACGDSVALLAWRTYSDTNPPPARGQRRLQDLSYLLAVVPGQRHAYRGRVDGRPSHLLGQLLGAHGRSFFFAHHRRYDYPVVDEVKLNLPPVDRTR